MSSDVIEMPNVKAERAREAMLSELDGGTLQLRSVVDLDKYIAALAEIREQREECERLHTELAEAKAGREAERVARRELARDLTATDRERVQFRQERDAALARAEQSFIDGRTAERADVVDWLRYPPGRVPDGALLLVGELWRSIVAGAHESRDSKALERLTAQVPPMLPINEDDEQAVDDLVRRMSRSATGASRPIDARQSATELPREASSGRCEVTGNPCGTDTWALGHPCKCGPCQTYVASLKAQEHERWRPLLQRLAEWPRPDALARIDTLSDEQLEAEAAQAMAERPEPHGDCEGCIEVAE
jgi:uncharacterized small protein (DUF1192 family)